MKKALYIALMVYFLLALLGGAELWRDFTPRSFGGTAFQVLFLLWTVDGLFCMVLGIAMLIRHVPLLFEKQSLYSALLGFVAVVFGVVPSYILVELIYKLVESRPQF